MSKWMYILLLPLLLLPTVPLQGQRGLDTCMCFDDVALTPGEQVLPDGWTFLPAHVADTSSAYVRGWIGYNHSKGILFSSAGSSYLSLPDLGLDSYDGYWIQLHLRLSYYGSIAHLGAMSDPMDSTTFVPLEQFWYSPVWRNVTVDLSALPADCRHLTFLNIGSELYPSTLYIDEVRLTRNPCLVRNFHLASLTADSAIFEWDEMGSPDKDIILYRYNPYSIDTLHGIEGQRYALPVDMVRAATVQLVSHSCGPSESACSDYYESEPIGIPLPDSTDCANIGLLYSDRCTPYYGDFDDPYANVGFVYYPTDSSICRHAILTDTAGRDPIVGDALRTIPEGETMSVRLGNWRIGHEAEAMQYRIAVDTARADMLILKYASVMQNSPHLPEDQPRFRIEILDEEANLIAPATCNSYDFIASTDLGWNEYGVFDDTMWSVVTLWKDWTVVGIDLNAYHGQTVLVRLTTFDCRAGGHYGYAYYTLSCAKKTIDFISCSSADSNRVAAPEGFTYRWWRDDAPLATLGTSREMTLPMDNHHYYCTMGFIGDPECSVSLSVLSRLVIPEAHFDYETGRDSCSHKVTFHNRSHLVGDTATRCAYTEWIFDDGTTSMLDDPVRWWSDTTTHIVTLVSGLSAIGDCFDTIRDTLRFHYAYDTSEAIICDGNPYHFHDTTLTLAGTHTLPPLCDTVHTICLTVLPSPDAAFGWEPTTPVDIAPDVQFFNLTVPDGCDYVWFVETEEGIDTLEGYEPYYHWDGLMPTGDFEVLLVASQLLTIDTIVQVCSDTARHTVTIIPTFLQFPNLVTPNGDGVNDRWEVVNLLESGAYTMNELWIYDAWGALIYHVENIRNINQFWDPLETRSPDGTYYFRFSAKNGHGVVRRNGIIEVLR